jgi:hypothetical protein
MIENCLNKNLARRQRAPKQATSQRVEDAQLAVFDHGIREVAPLQSVSELRQTSCCVGRIVHRKFLEASGHPTKESKEILPSKLVSLLNTLNINAGGNNEINTP